MFYKSIRYKYYLIKCEYSDADAKNLLGGLADLCSPVCRGSDQLLCERQTNLDILSHRLRRGLYNYTEPHPLQLSNVQNGEFARR